MTNEEIIQMFDEYPNLFLHEIAQMAGKSVEELKKILMNSRRWN
jgi:predicted HTH domain antitoxin